MGTPEGEHKAVVRRLIEQAFNAGDVAVINELVARDYVLHVAPEVRGPQGMQHFVTMYRTAFPDYSCIVDDQIAEGDKVVARWTATGTHRAEFAGVPATGKPVRITAINIHRVAGGQIQEGWLNWDALGTLQQLGAIPTPGQAAR